MKKNDVVRIYEDPVTCENFEGNAILIDEYRSDHGDGLSLWSVEFIGEDFLCIRTVNEKHIKE